MSTFDAMLAGYAPVLTGFLGRSAAGETALYVTAAGTATPIAAIVGEEQIRTIDGPAGREQMRERYVVFSTDPDAGGIASPQMNGLLRIDGVDWPITDLQDYSDTLVRAQCRIAAGALRSRRDLRSR